MNRPVRLVGPQYTDATYGAVCPVTINRYDSLGRLGQVSAGRTPSPCGTPANDVVGVQISYAYDDFDRLVKTTDALGRSRSAHYDANDNVDRATDAKGQTTQYTWGDGHQLKTRIEQGGRTTTYVRNPLGQPTSVTHPEASHAYDYDAAHRLKHDTDLRGNKTLSYDWSPGGWLNSVTDADGRMTSYRYDPVGRLAEITAPNGDSAAFRFDAGGRLTEKILANGVTSRYAYNEDDTLKQLVNRTTASAILSQHDYAYDGVGNRVAQTEAIGGTTLSYAYAYDELKRLTQVANGTAAQQENDAYDPLGNRTQRSVGQTSPTVTAYQYDAANELTEIHTGSLAGPLQATLSYDANGNLQSDGSRSYTWDALDQLSQVTQGTTTVAYGYDAEGRRVRKVTGGVTTQWLYDGQNLDAEYGSSWTNPNAVYTFAGLDQVMMRTRVTGTASYGQARYYAQDGLGSVVGVSNNTDSTTQVERFDAWGNKLSGAIPQSAQFGYTGREPDETGLVYDRARYYSPSIGRFVSRDPIGLQGGINLYAYVGNNPVNFTDPMGLVAQSPIVVAQGGTNYFGSNTMTDIGQSLQAFAQTSIDAGRNESFGDTADKLLQGIPIEGAALGAIGSIKTIELGDAAKSLGAGIADTIPTVAELRNLQVGGMQVHHILPQYLGKMLGYTTEAMESHPGTLISQWSHTGATNPDAMHKAIAAELPPMVSGAKATYTVDQIQTGLQNAYESLGRSDLFKSIESLIK